MADEILVQEVEGRFIPKKTRKLLSEIAFLRLPGNFEWLGFRHAKIVDGRPVGPNGPSLTELLATNYGRHHRASEPAGERELEA